MASSPKTRDGRSIREYLEAAVSIAEAAGPITLRYFRLPLDVDDKSRGVAFDPVTRADKEVEASIRDELGRLFPDHGILGEEQAERESSSPYRWFIDPIDGTRAFISGVPAWGILLGLTIGDVCTVGVMHQPYLEETFLGSAEGAWLRRAGKEQALRTRATAGLSSATLYCTHPAMFKSDVHRAGFERVAARARMTRFGGDCYSYCLLALGMIDLVIEGELKPYDIIPLIPIIEGAGGVVTTWRGEPANHGGLVIAAANPALHAAAIETLNA